MNKTEATYSRSRTARASNYSYGGGGAEAALSSSSLAPEFSARFSVSAERPAERPSRRIRDSVLGHLTIIRKLIVLCSPRVPLRMALPRRELESEIALKPCSDFFARG